MSLLAFPRVIHSHRQIACKLWSHSKLKRPLTWQCSFSGLVPTCRLQRFQVQFGLWPTLTYSKPGIPLSSHRLLVHSAQLTADNYIVKFVEEENEYFHKYLEDTEKFKKSLIFERGGSSKPVDSQLCSDILISALSKSFDKSLENVLNCLKHLSNLPESQINDLFINESFIRLCKCLISGLSEMTDTIFWDSMRTLARFDFRRCITSRDRTLRLNIAEAFDKECLRRRSHWDIRAHFLAADFFYHFRCSSLLRNKFMPEFMTYMENNLYKLSTSEIVVLMFHVNLHRYSRASLMHKLSEITHSKLGEFSVNELGVITLGFFKSKQEVRHLALLDAMISILEEKISRVDEICLGAFMKYIQRSTHKRMVKVAPHTYNSLIKMQSSLLPRMADLKISTALNIVTMYENIHDISEAMIVELCRKFLHENIRHWRIKDIARTTKLLGHLTCPLPEKQLVFEKIISEFECESRKVERQTFLESVCTCLLGLSMEGIYPQSLIQLIFSDKGQKFFDRLGRDYGRDLYHLSESVKIEAPDYTGPLYTRPYESNSPKKSGSHMSARNNHALTKTGPTSLRESSLQDMAQSYSHILGGSEFMHVGCLLSHYQTKDIEFRVHPCGNAIPVSKWRSNENNKKTVSGKTQNLLSSQLLDMATKEPTRKIAVLLNGISAYYTLRQPDGTVVQKLTGLHVVKGRQLQKLGYEVVQIPHFEFSEAKQKQDYLKMKTFGTSFDDHS